MFIELFIKNLATMTYHKSLRFEKKLEVFLSSEKKKEFFWFFWILDSEILIFWSFLRKKRPN